MADADHKRDPQQDEEPVLDLDVPEDEARSVEGGTPNIEKTHNATIKNVINSIRG